MEVDADGKELIIVGGDKKLPIYSINNGKKLRTLLNNDSDNKDIGF